MKQTVVIALCNQKGGVGKSTIAAALASQLHYAMGKTVAVIDCDAGQHSLFRLREREKQTIEKVDDYKRLMMLQWERIEKKVYPIMNTSPQNVINCVNDFLASDVFYDIIIVDLPGNISLAGVLTTIMNVDYVLTPIVADRFDMQSTLGFSTAVLDYKAARDEKIPLKGFLFFWNKVDRRVSRELTDNYNRIMEKLEFTVLSTVIPNLSRYGREMSFSGKPFFRSTLLAPDAKMLAGSNLDLFANEICERLKI